MKIDREEARRIATLAHIELDEEGLDRMAVEMTKILSYIELLREVDVTGFEVPALASGTPLRDDRVHRCVEQHLVARNAPEWKSGCFVVPQVIGGE